MLNRTTTETKNQKITENNGMSLATAAAKDAIDIRLEQCFKDAQEHLNYKGSSDINALWLFISERNIDDFETGEQSIILRLHKEISGMLMPNTPEMSILAPDDIVLISANNSEEKLKKELRDISPGIATGYKIGEIDLVFPGGALSVIAAPTSHGKTTALINFSLGALKQNTNTKVCFFTYEESSASILTLFLNTYLNEELSKNNRRSITAYFQGDTTQYIEWIGDKKQYFRDKKETFFKELIDSGRLKVIYPEMRVEKLIASIWYLKANTNVSLICIDYLQLLKLDKPGKSRVEELKEICMLFKDCAIQTGLPIVFTAQFNRTVTTEANVFYTNISEAGDIERIAHLIIGMYNRNFLLDKDGNKGKDGKPKDQESKVYLEVLKGRGIGNGQSCVMDFNGNLGTITQVTTTTPLASGPTQRDSDNEDQPDYKSAISLRKPQQQKVF